MRTLCILCLPILVIACHKDNDASGSPEMVIIDSVITTTVGDHGFVYFYPSVSWGTDWTSPYDFYNGYFEYRFEIMGYPTSKAFAISLCIWADVEGKWESWQETCSGQVPVLGTGIYTARSSPADWWYMDDPVDFSRISDFYRMGMVLWCYNHKNLSDWTPSSSSCWDQRNYFLPLTLRLTVVAVADGYTFSGWDEYVD